VDWLYKRMQALLSRAAMPNYIVTTLSEMIRARSPAITLERTATLEESEAMEVAQERPGAAPRREENRRPRYVTEEIGQLDGFAALYPENDHASVDHRPVPGPADLRALTWIASDRDPSRWSKWGVEIDGKPTECRYQGRRAAVGSQTSHSSPIWRGRKKTNDRSRSSCGR
jgi:hypothetical protein